MRDYKFDIASDFIRYVDKYDIRGSGAGMNYEAKTVTVYDYGKSMMGAESVVVVPSMMSDDEPNGPLKDGTNVQRINPELGLRGSMAVLWVRNEQSGFLHDGEFSRFNDSDKGAWAIADVMMVKATRTFCLRHTHYTVMLHQILPPIKGDCSRMLDLFVIILSDRMRKSTKSGGST